MGDEVLKKFGRYFLLDRIAQGGMAEIYRSRLSSPEGAGRILVIKRIQAGFNSNSEFLQMFKSEIKVTMGFNHPNIVQLYDFGDEDGMPYIAMEYVDGKNARQFANMFEKQKQKLPVEIAAHVIEQAAGGLYYAHSYRDKISGEALNVVHRDISPQNLLVAHDGNIKIIDFGIAKATTNSEATKAGIIKGKPSYLAPEQITGEDLDGRCDIFALGIVLWELLVGRKLFSAPGENEYAVLKLIESCDTYVKPPSQFNPQVPKDLDLIVMKALAKKREKRFQTAEEFQKALKRFILTTYQDFNPGEVSQWSKHLFKDEIVEDRKELQRLNARAEQLLQLELDDGGLSLQMESDAKPMAPRKEEKTFDSTDLEKEPAPSTVAVKSGAKPVPAAAPKKLEIESTPSSNPARRSGVITQPGFPSPSAAGTNPGFKSPQTGSHRIKRTKEGDYVEKGSSGGLFAALIFLGVLGGAGFFLYAKLGKSFKESVHGGRGVAGQTENPSGQTPGTGTVAHTKVSSDQISLKLNIVPSAEGAKIVLNDKPVDPANPVIKVHPNAPLDLYVERKNFRPFRREFVVRPEELGELKEWMIEVQLEPLRFGLVTIKSVPSAEASVYPIDASGRGVASDRKPWAILRTPVEAQKFPLGNYEVRLENKVLGMAKTIRITVEENRVQNVEERLEVLNK